MEQRAHAEPPKFLLLCEHILLALAVFVGVYHMLLSIYQFYDVFVGTFLEQLRHFLFNTLIVSCAGYCLLVKLKFPQTFWRITRFLRSLLCPEGALIFLFLLWYFISCYAVDARYIDDYLAANRLFTIDTAITILVLFPLCLCLPPEKRKAVLHFIIHVVSIVMTVLMLIALYYVFNSLELTVPGGKVYMSRSLRLNVVGNPNATGAYASVLFTVCVYMVFSQRRFIRAFYAFASLVHMLVLFLTNSVTCMIAVSSFLFVVTFMLCFHLLSKKSTTTRILISLIASICVVVLFHLLRSLSFTAFEAITHFSALNKKKPTIRTIKQNQINILARLNIWGYSIESMISSFHNAIFGVTPVGVIPTIGTFSDGSYNMYTHNQFLEVGVAMGFPGLILYTSWLILIARNCLKVGLAPESDSAPGTFVLPAAVLGLVVANLAESILLYYHFLPGAFFFLLCGAVTAESKLLGTSTQKRAGNPLRNK